MTTPAPQGEDAAAPQPQDADADPAARRYRWEPEDIQWGNKVKRKKGHAETLARQIAGD